VLLALFVFGGSLYLVRFLGSEFVPSQDQGRFVVNLETPVGSSADYTDAMLRKCEAFLGELPEVQGYFVSVGSLGGQERGVNKASMYITLKPLGQRRRTQAEILAITRRELGKIPGLRAFPQDLSQSGFSARRGFPVEFSVRGPNLERLHDYSERIMARMRETSGIVDVDSDYEVGMPEANVIPDRQKSADVGVDMASIGRTVNALIGGVDVAKFKDRGRRYDIRVRLMADQRATPASIGNLQVRSSRGSLIRLRDLAKVEERPSLLVISRQDRQRAISVQANLAQGKAQAEALAQVQRIADEVLPEGYQIVFSGSAQTFKESFDSLLFALMLGILIAYMVLASQFNDFAHPFTILVALPFSFTGAILALLATGHTLNIYSMIGLILLMGLVKKNSILLVDFTHQRREGGEDRETALLTACPIRLRPILMTSTATIVGALPACVAFGPGAETRVPMGIAVVGGMVFSTGLTLFVVPVVYTYLDDLATRLTRLRRGGAEGAEPVAAK
jgi:multidrug efflux pump subunit AcrB